MPLEKPNPYFGVWGIFVIKQPNRAEFKVLILRAGWDCFVRKKYASYRDLRPYPKFGNKD